jgi:hypothetical protein
VKDVSLGRFSATCTWLTRIAPHDKNLKSKKGLKWTFFFEVKQMENSFKCIGKAPYIQEYPSYGDCTTSQEWKPYKSETNLTPV